MKLYACIFVTLAVLSLSNCERGARGEREETGKSRIHRYLSPDSALLRNRQNRNWFPSRITGIFDEDPAVMSVGTVGPAEGPIGFPMLRVPYGFKGRFIPNYFEDTRVGNNFIASEDAGIGGSLGFGSLAGGVNVREAEKQRGKSGSNLSNIGGSSNSKKGTKRGLGKSKGAGKAKAGKGQARKAPSKGKAAGKGKGPAKGKGKSGNGKAQGKNFKRANN